MTHVTVIDYGVGNLLSVSRALAFCQADVEVTSDPATILNAERLVLPGVGAYGDCIAELENRQLDTVVREFATSGRPLLGICVGMQILFDAGDEFGAHKGLGLIAGTVRAIPPVSAETGDALKIPHIGWTPLVEPDDNGREGWEGTILAHLKPSDFVYFVHSYTAWPHDPTHRLADASYDGQRVSAVVQNGNVWGTQFHPEKSGPIGLEILRNFLKLT